MKILFPALLLTLGGLSLPVAAQAPQLPKEELAVLKYEGGNGSTLEKAVIIKGLKDEVSALKAAYLWVDRNFTNYQPEDTNFDRKDGKSYVIVSFVLVKEGRKVNVYFDVTDSLPPRKGPS